MYEKLLNVCKCYVCLKNEPPIFWETGQIKNKEVEIKKSHKEKVYFLTTIKFIQIYFSCCVFSICHAIKISFAPWQHDKIQLMFCGERKKYNKLLLDQACNIAK
jgi:hypothetical protein